MRQLVFANSSNEERKLEFKTELINKSGKVCQCFDIYLLKTHNLSLNKKLAV